MFYNMPHFLLQSNVMSRQQLKDAMSWMSGDKSDKTEVLKATVKLDQVCSFGISLGTLFCVNINILFLLFSRM